MFGSCMQMRHKQMREPQKMTSQARPNDVLRTGNDAII